MKHGRIFLVIAVILISMLAINQFVVASCRQCTDKEIALMQQNKAKCQCTY
jgi:hypothetical protein